MLRQSAKNVRQGDRKGEGAGNHGNRGDRRA